MNNVGYAWLCVLLMCLGGLSCSTNNVIKEERFTEMFDSAGVKGCFALYDNAQGKFSIHNLTRFRDSLLVPGAAFHPVLTLIALKTGRAADEQFAFRNSPADTVTLRQAFAGGDTAWFGRMAEVIGRDTLQRWMDSLSYGNRRMDGLTRFWYSGSLQVKPDEQLGLLERLYFDQLPFDKRSMRITRDLMEIEQNSLYTMRYMQSRTPGGQRWLGGWIVENRHPYFFLMQAEDPGQEATRTLLWRLLRSQGLGYGKR